MPGLEYCISNQERHSVSMTGLKGYVGITDDEWFEFLSRQVEIDEVNFWQPGGRTVFRALEPGEPFFFKLHAPNHFIAGGGFFAHSTIMPLNIAWGAFGLKNGAGSLPEMRALIERRRSSGSMNDNIGCILLQQPFFFERRDWIPLPPDLGLHTQKGKTYNLREGHGRKLWEEVQLRIMSSGDIGVDSIKASQPAQRYGAPVYSLPRLGQGSFRLIVTDAYERKCAVTQERVLPALEAVHIKPYSTGGEHRVDNGMLLRSDIHKLFDAGYVTVTPEYRFEVSKRVREEFDNGKTYYDMRGRVINLPRRNNFKPGREFLSWHNENVFAG